MTKKFALLSAAIFGCFSLVQGAAAQSDLVPHPVGRSFDIGGEAIMPSKTLSVVDDVSGVKTSFYAPAVLTALIARQGNRAVKFDRFDDFIMVQPMPSWVRENGLDTSVFVPPRSTSTYRFEIFPPDSTDRTTTDVAGFAAWPVAPDMAPEAQSAASSVDRALVSYSTACEEGAVHFEGSPVGAGQFHFGLFACGAMKDSPDALKGQMALVLATFAMGREFQWYREWRGEAFDVAEHKTAGPVSAADFQAEFEHLITWASVHGPLPPQDFAASVLVAEQLMAAASLQSNQ